MKRSSGSANSPRKPSGVRTELQNTPARNRVMAQLTSSVATSANPKMTFEPGTCSAPKADAMACSRARNTAGDNTPIKTMSWVMTSRTLSPPMRRMSRSPSSR